MGFHGNSVVISIFSYIEAKTIKAFHSKLEQIYVFCLSLIRQTEFV